MDLKELKENPLVVKYKPFLLPIFVGVICIFLIVFLLIPQMINYFNIQKTINNNESRLRALNSKIEALKKVNLEDYKSKINTALGAVPSDKEIPSALGQILFLVNSSSLKLEAMNISSAVVPVGSLNTFTIKIEVTGDLDGVKDLIEKVKVSPRIMKISSLELNQSPNTKLRAGLVFNIYFQQQAAGIGAVDKPVSLLTSKDEEILAVLNTYARTVPVTTDVEQAAGPRGKDDPFN